MNYLIPSFENRKDLFDYLRKNKQTIINIVKSQIKMIGKAGEPQANEPYYGVFDMPKMDKAFGNNSLPSDTGEVIYRTVCINASNIIDSYMQAHIGDIFSKSIQENSSRITFFQEHEQKLDKIIADGQDLKVYMKQMTWQELNYNRPGFTNALLFDAAIRKNRNKFMFDQYSAGYVKQHSVGMRIIKMAFCMNSPESDDYEEKVSWDKYYPMLVNPEVADANGYFFVVLEGQVLEGSAVALGACPITPVVDNNGGTQKSYYDFSQFEKRIEILENKNIALEKIIETIKPQTALEVKIDKSEPQKEELVTQQQNTKLNENDYFLY